MKRSRYEIIAEILEYCHTPRKFTQIVQYCNLSTPLAKQYIELLLGRELLTVKDGNLYETTNNGLKFLNFFEKLYKMILY